MVYKLFNKNENEGRFSRETDSVDFVLCVRRISKCVEREYIGGFRIWKFRI